MIFSSQTIQNFFSSTYFKRLFLNLLVVVAFAYHVEFRDEFEVIKNQEFFHFVNKKLFKSLVEYSFVVEQARFIFL